MKKKVGIIKRVSCLGLIFLLTINSFAAIVGDNDGSAFITKAEFDALKSSFQSQIDGYNQSIDSKIDGAIASYLAGIKLSKEENKNILLNGFDTASYFDDPSYVFEYASPTISLTSFGLIKSFNSPSPSLTGVATLDFHKIDCLKSGSPMKAFVTNLVDYNINGGKIDIKQLKLNCYSEDITPSLSTTGNIKINDLGSRAYHDIYRIWIGLSGESMATGSSFFDDINIFKSYSYRHFNNGGIKESTTVDDFYTPTSNVYSIDIKNTSNKNYFVAYDGETSQLVINASSSPFTYLGADDINQTLTPTETYKDFFNGDTLSIDSESREIGMAHNSGEKGVVLGIKSVTKDTSIPTDKYNGVLGGLGYFGGHNIIQSQSNFSGEGINISDPKLSAGFPLLIEKNNVAVTWEPTFTEVGNYRIWLSYEPFDVKNYDTNHGKPAAGLDFVDINEKVPGESYVEINSGKSCKITFTMMKTSPVYLKWSKVESGVDVAKGTIDLTKCNVYMSKIQE